MDRPQGEATETPSERDETSAEASTQDEPASREHEEEVDAGDSEDTGDSDDDGPDVPPEDDRDKEPAEVVEERLGAPPMVEEVPGTTAPTDHVTDEEQDIEPSGVSPGAGPDEEPGPDTEEPRDAEAREDDA